ncbi:protein-disulfide reductase DsbD [Steroidobacter sp. S1-65]|uniref:Thiol:disulfide interchange protein DsbD n=1 Tax=Steroidobacter gossypii TaxID=2805490 RepID=A0ABS1WR73_9GAMM|nr:protein-disulfide reductase DsbD [Steroidobacter gossypii]MBM0103475.1 protein-disulfide reductase DsbD [Steroidobacter gossypii]
MSTNLNSNTRQLSIMVWAAALAWLASLSAAQAKEDFLPPEQAYRYTVEADGDRVVVNWKVAPGYYLYKKKMGVASTMATVQTAEPDWPKGQEHTDEYFGTQEIYRGSFAVPVAFTLHSGERPKKLALELKLQGCADAGLCYPPLRWKTEVDLPAAGAGGGLSSLFKSKGGGFGAPKRNDDFLPPDEAFRFGPGMEQPDKVALTWIIAEDYYLYKDRIQVTTDTPGVTLGRLQLPEGKPKHDEYFGDTEVYYEVLEASLPIARPAGAGTLDLNVTYQGCAEGGLCYNPITKQVSLELPPTDRATTLPADAQPTGTSAGGLASSSKPPVAEQDRLASLIRDGNLFAVLATFFGLGILLSLTPCVLPMIPILSGIIVGQGGTVTPARGFSLAFTYVQGMALTYAAAGAAFVLAFQQAPQAFFQQPWIIGLMTLLFVVLALAMFGAFTLQLPSALQTRLTNVSNQQKSGTFVGTFIMGALSALVVTACVAPAIIAALSVISQTGQIARGAGALYATGLGMGVPLLIVGASAGSLLPKVGPWMDTVKSLFGVLFLGVAIYLVSPLLPGAAVMLLWSLLAVLSGFWIFSLKARDGSPVAAPLRAAGLVALVYGILLLIGTASGSKDPLQPLDRLASGGGGASTQEHALAFQRIKTVADLENAVAAATAAGKPVMLDFYADWCVSCKEMEKFTFPDPGVQAVLANVVLLQADVTANDEHDRELMTRFGIYGPPTIAFYGADGVERTDFRLVGFMGAEPFREHARAAFGS